MSLHGHNLETLTEQVNHLRQLKKADVHPGDWVLVTTCNSEYSIMVQENNRYTVSGGWFDAHGLSPHATTISGCTWGGAPILMDALATCGLCLEFGKPRVITSPVRRVCVIAGQGEN